MGSHLTRHRATRALAALAVLAGLLSFSEPASATHGLESLSGSTFEIDTDANLKVDHDSPSIDWASVAEIPKEDSPSGKGDESFGQGTDENEPNPVVVSGSIPPNKSDLKWFGLYQEGATSTGFLALYWSRVQEPVGTTNMDFELNQRRCTPGQDPVDPDCAPNGITPIRSVDDKLITYDLSKGGTVPTLSLRSWTGTVWGAPADLTANGDARGSINTSTILAADADGLGEHSPRTFGEAHIKMSALFAGITSCTGFGSAYLKSRASDSFNSALKDFVPPQDVDLTSCGQVQITKTFTAGTAPSTPAVFAVRTDAAPIGTSIGSGDDLFTYSNFSTLSAGISDTATSMSVVDGSKYPAGNFYVLIDNEIIKVSHSTATSTTLSVLQRSVGVPPAATHSTGVDVKRMGACDISTSGGTCTISNLPFGTYWAEEIEVPLGYTGGNPQSFVLSASTPSATLTFSNQANPVDVTVSKQDDNTPTANPIAICANAGTPTQPCADFELYTDGGTGAASTLASALTDSATTVSVADGSVFGSALPFKVIVGSEIMNVTAVDLTATPNSLTVERAQLNTAAAAHLSGAAVTKLTLDKECNTTATTGECQFASVQPAASYWIVESVAPTGYGRDSTLPMPITVNLGDASSSHVYTFTNPRLFKVITFVCGEFDGQLYESGIVYDSTTMGSGTTPTSTPAGVDETVLCGASGDHVHGGVGTGNHDTRVNIGT